MRHLPPLPCVLFVRAKGVLWACLHSLVALISSPPLTLLPLVSLKNDVRAEGELSAEGAQIGGLARSPLRTHLSNHLALISSPPLPLFSTVFLKNDAAPGNLPLPVQLKFVNLAHLPPLLLIESLPSSLQPALRPLLEAELSLLLTILLLPVPSKQIDLGPRLLLLRPLRLLLLLSTA